MAYGVTISALADPTRRAVFEGLRHGPRAVGELANDLPVSRPAVSQHLRVLREARLVRERRDGARRLYSVDRAGLEELRTYLESYWDDALESFRAAAEAQEKGERDD